MSALSSVGPGHNLPAAPAELVGRESVVRDLDLRLRDPACRLLTITGPGGVGKTRLALEVAHRLSSGELPLPPFLDGVYFVALAPLRPSDDDGEQLASLLAEAIGLDLGGPQPTAARLAAALREKRLLIVLDTCEHLPGLANRLADLLAFAPGLSFLVTSRARLDIRAEQVLTLEGLSLPDGVAAAHERDPLARSGAARLFMARARAVTPGFEITPAEVPAVARICHMLGGLPLGLELAAGWTALLSVGEIADEIGRSLDFLVAATHDLPARQQSLRAVFASSWELLGPDEQRALRRLTSFRGSFSREAAAAVAGAGLLELAGLLRHSLLQRVGRVGEETRYMLPEPLRSYAAEQLAAAGEDLATAERHARYALGWLAAQAEALRGPAQAAAARAVGAELPEIRAAWAWAVAAADAEALGAAAEALFRFATMRSRFQEGAAMLLAAAEALADRGPAAAIAHGRTLARAGWCIFQLGRPAEARALLERSLAALRPLDTPAELVVPLNYLASAARYTADYPEALALAEEGLAISRAAGDRYGTVITATTLSQTYADMGRHAEARRYAQESVAIERDLGNHWGAAFNLITLGQIARPVGDLAEARRRFGEALAICEGLEHPRGAALCLSELGETSEAAGDLAEAASCYARSLALHRGIGNQWGASALLLRLGRLAAGVGHQEAAARLLAEALGLASELGAAPQAAAAIAAAARLARAWGVAEWAARLEAVAGSRPAALAAAADSASRLLAWPGVAALGLDQAVAAVERASAVTAGPQGAVQPPAPLGGPAPGAGAVQPPAPLGGPAPGAAPGAGAASSAASRRPAGLTPRELAVLRLVAQGLTDVQVAERLILSPRTVSSYLTSIYAKLGVSSRTAAARWAIEQGLA